MDRSLQIGKGVGGIVVIATALFSPWLFGYVEPWSQFASSVCVLFGAAICGLPVGKGRKYPWTLLILTGFTLIGLLQLLPLTPAVLKAVSPSSFETRVEFYTGADRQELLPLSLVPFETRRGLTLGIICLLSMASAFRFAQSKARLVGVLWGLSLVAIGVGYVGTLCQIIDQGVYGFIPTKGAYFGGFGNRNNAAGFFCMALSGAMYLLHRSVAERNEETEQQSASPRPRSSGRAIVVSGLAVLQIAGAVLCTTSRGGLIAMLTVVISYLAVSTSGRLGRRMIIGGVSLLLLLVISFGYLTNFGDSERFQERVLGLVDGQALADDSRPQHWADSIATAALFPLFGTGQGTYSYAYRLLDSQHLQQTFFHAENIFVETLLETGIIGFSFLMMFIACFLSSAIRRWRRGNRSLAALMIAFLAGQCVSNSFDFGLLLFGNALIFSVLVGSFFGAMSHASSSPEKLKLLERLQPTSRGVIALLLVLALPLVFKLPLLSAQNSILQTGNLLTIDGWVAVDTEFELGRSNKAIEACPDDATLYMRRGDCLVEMLIASRGERSDLSVGSYLWKLHAEVIKGRNVDLAVGKDGVGFQSPELQDSEIEILTRAYSDYRTASSLNGLIILAHKRVAQLSFLYDDIDGEMIALRRCVSLREGVCRVLFRDGMLALRNGDSVNALKAFRECLSYRTSYESKILDVSIGRFSNDQITTQLLPADPVRIFSAADYYRQRNQEVLSESLFGYAETLSGTKDKAFAK